MPTNWGPRLANTAAHGTRNKTCQHFPDKKLGKGHARLGSWVPASGEDGPFVGVGPMLKPANGSVGGWCNQIRCESYATAASTHAHTTRPTSSLDLIGPAGTVESGAVAVVAAVVEDGTSGVDPPCAPSKFAHPDWSDGAVAGAGAKGSPAVGANGSLEGAAAAPTAGTAGGAKKGSAAAAVADPVAGAAGGSKNASPAGAGARAGDGAGAGAGAGALKMSPSPWLAGAGAGAAAGAAGAGAKSAHCGHGGVVNHQHECKSKQGGVTNTR